jgi:hypothetical protein
LFEDGNPAAEPGHCRVELLDPLENPKQRAGNYINRLGTIARQVFETSARRDKIH